MDRSIAIVITAICVVAIMSSTPAGAQNAPGDPDARLEEVERSLKNAETKAGRLDAEAESIAEEREQLRQKLIDSAARIQDREQQMSASEQRLVSLGDEESSLQEQLARRRNTMADMLAALQKLEREPPPVLAVRPGDAVAAIRSAMLLATVVPQIRAEADALSRELRKLATLREEIVEERRQLAINRVQMEREHEVIERLLEVKNQLADRTLQERDAARRRAEALAAEASSLRELLASLETERREIEAEEAERQEALAVTEGEPAEADAPTAEERRLAMARPDRLEPAVAFASAQGMLSWPARGTVVRRFGADDGYGGAAKGISIATRPSAQVTAPADGWVVYAGAFRGYGQLLIIDAGDGYHVLLAGMSRIDVSLGQFVLAGEPVGRMGQNATQHASIGAAPAQDQPVLYVEFRKEGSSIDPHPWWAAANVKARG